LHGGKPVGTPAGILAVDRFKAEIQGRSALAVNLVVEAMGNLKEMKGPTHIRLQETDILGAEGERRGAQRLCGLRVGGVTLPPCLEPLGLGAEVSSQPGGESLAVLLASTRAAYSPDREPLELAFDFTLIPEEIARETFRFLAPKTERTLAVLLPGPAV